MFWKKKPAATAPVTAETTGAASGKAAAPVAHVEGPKSEKLPGPKELPYPVGRDIVVQLKQNPDWVWSLRSVVRHSQRGKKVFDVRVFDEAQAARKKVKVKDWTTLDEHPDLILYEGWYSADTMQTELEEKKAA